MKVPWRRCRGPADTLALYFRDLFSCDDASSFELWTKNSFVDDLLLHISVFFEPVEFCGNRVEFSLPGVGPLLE